MMKYFLGIDVGGSWIKATAIQIKEGDKEQDIKCACLSAEVIRIESKLQPNGSCDDFIHAIDTALERLHISYELVAGIGISTAGIVNYHGTKLILCAPHLSPLQSNKWIDYLKVKTSSPVVMINDADAVTIGAAALGYLTGNITYGVMPIGTGIGFTVVRNGRRWTPNYSLPLIGSIYSPCGGFDQLGSASLLSRKTKSGSLQDIFLNQEYQRIKEDYLHHLVGIISSAHILYGIDEILLGGGIIDAAVAYGFDKQLEIDINALLKSEGILTSVNMNVRLLKEGNKLALLGALMLSIGESQAQSLRKIPSYKNLKTEIAYDSSLFLDKMDTHSVLNLLNKVELEAAINFEKSIPMLSEVVGLVTAQLEKGGRLIYVGCGTSGRLAAIDAVEIACTFGFPRENVLTFISGGIADAAIDIETNFEEDASSVPDLLIANVTSKDVIIGISVSGSAYYVQSALGYGKYLGSLTVMIQETENDDLPFCDFVLPLSSGSELLAGSTRMKAGTATKKITNFISTTVMIKLGKVHGTYMTELECINDKLIKRATHILESLYRLNETDALDLLKKHQYKLNNAINSFISK